MATTPIVARLVIITEYAGNIRAELFWSPKAVIFLAESVMNIVPADVRSEGEYQTTPPSLQYSKLLVEGVPPPKVSKTSPIASTSHPSDLTPQPDSTNP